MVNWMHYYEIQKFKRKGFSKSKTAEKIGINRETVGVYWNMSAKEFEAKLESAKTRVKKADPHKCYSAFYAPQFFMISCKLKEGTG